MKKVRYEEMLPHEIVARRKKYPVGFLGLGVMEWHGEHLAVGNDALKVDKLCELAAEKSGGFAFPTMWYGEPRSTRLLEANTKWNPGVMKKMHFKAKNFIDKFYGKSSDDQISFYKKLIKQTLYQLESFEMKAACLVCGHYPLYEWVKPVVEEYNKEKRGMKVFTGIEFHYPPEKLQKNGSVGGDHAGAWETAYLWYLRPDCIDMSVYKGREQEDLIGVMGQDPRKFASLEMGRKAVDLIVDGMVAHANKLLKKK